MRARLDSPWPGRVNRQDCRIFKPDDENRIEIFCKDITRIRNITYIINAFHTLTIIYIIYAPDTFPLDMVTRHCAGRRGGVVGLLKSACGLAVSEFSAKTY